MSFGFSVGDFIAVGSIIANIVSSLREAGGSKSEYQEILRELEGLQHALSYLDKLQSSGECSTNIDSIKYAALSCRRPLEQFLDKIKKYDNTLGVWSKGGKIRSTTDKLKWAYTQKDEIRKLQTYLNVHVGTINILLAEHGLERMDIASEKSDRDQLHVRDRLEDTRKVIERINSSTQSQAQAVAAVSSMLGKLFQMVSGEVMASLKSLSGIVSSVCVSTQQIYAVVLEIRSAIGPGDLRLTYFQAPLIVEDALGFKFPVPSEYDHSLLDAIIKHRFSEGPGSLDVSLDNYELFHARDSSRVISPQVRLLPGTSIIMAILVGRTELSDQECPMPRCRSNKTTVAPMGGGRICCECNVFFDKSSKKRRGFQDLLDGISQQSSEVRLGKRKSDSHHDAPRKRLKTSSQGDDMRSFKNVRWTVENIPLKDPLTEVVPNDIEIASEVTLPESSSNDITLQLPKPFLNDALDYLDLVKAEYSDKPETYNAFLDMMKAFKDKLLDTQGVIDHTTHLFEGNEKLIQRFNLFLPPGYSMPVGAHSDPTFSWAVPSSDRSSDLIHDHDRDPSEYSELEEDASSVDGNVSDIDGNQPDMEKDEFDDPESESGN